MKISTKIRASLLGTALIPLILFFGIAYLSIERTLIRSAENRLELDAMTYANTVMGMLEQAVDEVESWSKLETLQTVFTGEDLDLRMGLLLRNLNESNHFLEIWCLDTDGNIIAASDFYKVGKDISKELNVDFSLQQQKYISDVVSFNNGTKPSKETVIITQPIYAAFDEESVIGSVVAFYNWGNVQSLTTRLNNSYADGHENISLLKVSGNVIIKDLDLVIGNKLSESYSGERVVGRAQVEQETLGIVISAEATMEKSAVLESIHTLANIVLGGALIVTLITILVSLRLAQVISEPIVSLSATAREISGGNLDVRPQFQSEDEIGQLALDFDIMRNNLKEHIQSLDATVLERTSELEDTVQQLRQEITDREAAETQVNVQQQQLVQADKMVSLGILVSGVAHEINNPNGLIGLNTSILKEVWTRAEPVLDEYAKEHGDFSLGAMNYSDMRKHMTRIFEELSKSSDRIKTIVSDLKEFSQKRSDRSFETIDINHLVQSSLDLVSVHLEKHSDSIHVELAENLPTVQGAFQRLEQVLVNVLLNAADSLSDSSGAIRVQTQWNQQQNTVSVRIEDEGCGIKEEDMPYITDPFFTTRREVGGTGLGLSVSSSIIEEHKGELSFESTYGSGTIVTLILPVHDESKK